MTWGSGSGSFRRYLRGVGRPVESMRRKSSGKRRREPGGTTRKKMARGRRWQSRFPKRAIKILCCSQTCPSSHLEKSQSTVLRQKRERRFVSCRVMKRELWNYGNWQWKEEKLRIFLTRLMQGWDRLNQSRVTRSSRGSGNKIKQVTKGKFDDCRRVPLVAQLQQPPDRGSTGTISLRKAYASLFTSFVTRWWDSAKP